MGVLHQLHYANGLKRNPCKGLGRCPSVAYVRRVSSPSQSRELIHRARALLAESRSVLDAGNNDSSSPLPSDLLGLYDALRGRLSNVCDEDVAELLAAVSETVDELARLAEDLDRVKSLRSALVGPGQS